MSGVGHSTLIHTCRADAFAPLCVVCHQVLVVRLLLKHFEEVLRQGSGGQGMGKQRVGKGWLAGCEGEQEGAAEEGGGSAYTSEDEAYPRPPGEERRGIGGDRGFGGDRGEVVSEAAPSRF